jgi:hypothetical protein
MSQVTFKNESLRFLVGAVLASTLSLALAACGGGSLQTPRDGGGNQNPGEDWDLGDVVDYNPDAELPSISHSFTVTGTGGTAPTYTTPTIVGADSLLKVRVVPGPAERLRLPGSQFDGFHASYACITYRVSLILGSSVSQTRVTRRLATGSHASYPFSPSGGTYNPCQGAVQNDTIDFSSRLFPGHPAARVRVDQVKTDFQCAYYWTLFLSRPTFYYLNMSFGSVCPSPTDLHKLHSATGTLEIQVNGSNL